MVLPKAEAALVRSWQLPIDPVHGITRCGPAYAIARRHLFQAAAISAQPSS